tara:strand:+ start:23052 stop:23606 length:555 start_codon:yes stop_codon:yes gene_type:complete
LKHQARNLIQIICFDELTVFRNHYEILGVPSSADGEMLHKAFRKLSKELHPDTTSLPQSEASARFHQVCQAYESLADPLLRKAYDMNLAEMSLEIEKEVIKSDVAFKNSFQKKNKIGERRPLSGGELFSLLLLVIALLMSLLLGIGFAIAQGRELMIRPTWLTLANTTINVIFLGLLNGTTTIS